MTQRLRFIGNRISASEKIEEIRVFQDEIDALITEKNNSLKKIDSKIFNNEKVENQIFHFAHTLNRNHRAAVIISLVTFLEMELQNFCLDLQFCTTLKLSYTELKGTILEQFKTYVNKLAELNIDFGTDIWQSVKEVVEMRNCLVHYNGQIEDCYGRQFSRTDSIKRLSKRFSSVQIEESGFILLDKESCDECISIVEKFINIIYESALQRFPKDQDDDTLEGEFEPF